MGLLWATNSLISAAFCRLHVGYTAWVTTPSPTQVPPSAWGNWGDAPLIAICYWEAMVQHIVCDIASNCVERFANGEIPQFAVREHSSGYEPRGHNNIL